MALLRKLCGFGMLLGHTTFKKCSGTRSILLYLTRFLMRYIRESLVTIGFVSQIHDIVSLLSHIYNNSNGLVSSTITKPSLLSTRFR